tara:strand:- start:2586 stop:2783 length:198 start_codon:yes stop_codon:yes gene_type:complete
MMKQIEDLGDDVIKEVEEEDSISEPSYTSSKNQKNQEAEAKKTLNSKSALMMNMNTAYHTNTVTE